jgi:hypothetical protein
MIFHALPEILVTFWSQSASALLGDDHRDVAHERPRRAEHLKRQRTLAVGSVVNGDVGNTYEREAIHL